jgi:ABC-type multidrug transport system fused ATPase/permease subunit
VEHALSIVLFNIAPVCADFCAALVILATVGWRLVTVLGLFVLVSVGTLALFGQRGTPRHRAYADRAAEVGGALIDVVSNIWQSRRSRHTRRSVGASRSC